MKVNKSQEIQYQILLTEKEALWLKAVVQNPVGPPEEEILEEKALRKEFFENLEDVLGE